MFLEQQIGNVLTVPRLLSPDILHSITYVHYQYHSLRLSYEEAKRLVKLGLMYMRFLLKKDSRSYCILRDCTIGEIAKKFLYHIPSISPD